MFNRTTTVMHNSPSDIHYTIEEKRAPTEESVRLLREMEREVINRVDGKVRLHDNDFECVAHAEFDDLNGETVIYIRFMLAGRRMKTECRIEGDKNIDAVGQKVVDSISKTIAQEALGSMAQSMLPMFHNLLMKDVA
ncbi:hypothetical protein V6767_20130 [Martelella sp. FLE1502]